MEIPKNVREFLKIGEIKSTGVFHVTLPVRIFKTDDTILLPYLEGINQKYYLNSFGGSGLIMYKSLNPEIAVVRENGVISGKKIGTTVIEAFDYHNPNNKDRITVEISPIGHTYFVEENKEVFVGTEYDTFVISTDAHGRRYSNCTQTPYKLTSDSQKTVSAV